MVKGADTKNLDIFGMKFLRETRFTKFFVKANSLDNNGFEEWIFLPGMLFNAVNKWWGDKLKRDRNHEGLDLCLYRGSKNKIFHLSERTKIPVIYDGVIVKVTDDFLGKSLIIKHTLSDDDKHGFYTIYGHTKPSHDVHVGRTVKEGDIIGTLAESRKKKIDISPHLHISIGWTSKIIPYDDLEWKTMSDSNTMTMMDPIHIIRGHYFVLENEF